MVACAGKPVTSRWLGAGDAGVAPTDACPRATLIPPDHPMRCVTVISYVVWPGDRYGSARGLDGVHSVTSAEDFSRPAHEPVDAIAMAAVDPIGDHQLGFVAERDAMP